MRASHRVTNPVGTFCRNERGNFALITALGFSAILMAVGAATDYGAAVSRKSSNQSALDSAVLAAVAAPNLGSAKKILADYYESNGGLGKPKLTDFSNIGTSRSATAVVDYKKPNAFAAFLGFQSIDIANNATAEAPTRLTSMIIKPDDVNGSFTKTVTLHGISQTTGTDETLATIEYVYNPSYAPFNGDVNTDYNPFAPISISGMDDIYFQMDIDPARSGYPESIVLQQMRTDDPDTSYTLFVDGVQLPKGVSIDLADYVKCGEKARFEWEDMGDFAEQDFFFYVTGQCESIDATKIRLSK